MTARRRRKTSAGSLPWLAWPLIAGYVALLAAAVWRQAAPWWVVPAAAALSVVAFLAYWRDKQAAQRGRWRTPEKVLHAWSLAGGWPGAWLAQKLLRHKSSKPSFLLTYWLTVAAHVAAVGGWLWWSLRG